MEDASVVYSYRYYDTFITPMSDPSCPGYNDALLDIVDNIQEPEAYDAMEDSNVKEALNNKTEVKESEEEEESSEEEEVDIEVLLSEIDNTVMSAQMTAQNQLMKAMTLSVNVQSYYNKKIKGGVYKETQVMKDKHLPDNKRGARMGLAQQVKHNEMVDSQYNRGE